jgi:UDP-GlcNAc:undecaprenyl-phosphate GlcNAc-1-phosphate transferase
MFYFFIAAVFISGVATFFVRKLALACGTVDVPDGNRKKHRGAVPLWGGLALFVSFWLTILGCIIIGKPYTLEVYFSKLWGIFFGSLILVVVGLVDDKKSLGVYFRFLAAIISIVVVIYGGLGLAKITHPGGGIIYLTSYQVSVPFLGAISIGQVIVFFWLLAMMFTTKILDGLDGLSTGIALIGGLMIFFLAETKKYYQPDIALVALIFAGVCLGFLLFNFHPAKIFLGEGGSLFVGFMLGVLAVISGGKIATTLLVVAVPMLDLLRVVWVRHANKRPIFEGDREHLHFKLLDYGFSEPKTVLFLYAVAIVFGLTTFFLQSKFKIVTLLGLTVAMVLVGMWLQRVSKNNK